MSSDEAAGMGIFASLMKACGYTQEEIDKKIEEVEFVDVKDEEEPKDGD